MDDREVQALASVIIILFVFVILLCPVIALWIYIIGQNFQRKRIRERILTSRADLIGDNRWFAVRYASQPRFDLTFKIVPWDTAGILVIAPGSVLFLGESLAGVPLTLQFAPANSRLKWIGKSPWPNGAVSWLVFETANGKQYFSSETGITVFGSQKSTREIYDEATRNFAPPPAQNR
jgi:hypothetical protein